MIYFYGIVIVLYNLLLYAIFRTGIYDYLRLSKMSRSNIKKNRKGLKNYWMYQSINNQTPLGILYSLNYIFLISTIIFTILVIATGFIKMFQPFLVVIAIILCLVEIPSSIIASIYSNKMEYGRAFVFFAKRKYMRGYSSSIIDIFSWGITAFLIFLLYQQL